MERDDELDDTKMALDTATMLAHPSPIAITSDASNYAITVVYQ